jgi:hypothetical protein
MKIVEIVERLPDELRLPQRLLADLDQALVEWPLLGDGRVRLTTDDALERLQGAPHHPHPVAEEGSLA